MTTSTALEPIGPGRTTVTRNPARQQEALLGLLFVAPATIITLIFGLLPVVYGFFLSLQGGVAFPEGFVGLAQFVRALGGLAYLLGIAIALIFALGGYQLFRQASAAMQRGGGNFYPYLIPAFIAAPAILMLSVMLFLGNYGYLLIPIILVLIALGTYIYLNANSHHSSNLLYTVNSLLSILLLLSAGVLVLFVLSELKNYVEPVFDVMRQVITDRKFLRYQYIAPLMPQFLAWGGAIAGVTASYMIGRVRHQIDLDEHPGRALLLNLGRMFSIVLAIGCVIYILSAVDLLNGSVAALGSVTPETLAKVTSLELPDLVNRVLIWPSVCTVLLGICLIGLSFLLWSEAGRRTTARGTFSTFLVAIILMIGGWLFIGELPSAGSGGDPAFYLSLLRTATYASVTVPVELLLGLLLAYLLFHEVTWGKSLYRVIFFIPYIAPTVATATVFAMIFSDKPTGFLNNLLSSLGVPAQRWLVDPRGIFEIIAVGGKRTLNPSSLPPFLVGPSMPLVAAMLFGIWVFSGYNAVIFLAGLGAVPKEMYEAAEVDGAGRWARFRNVTLPLISPTTYFLTLLAIVGTFKAFENIYVLRADPRGAMDTAMVYIYEIIRTTNPSRAYAAALSVVLFGVILILTIIQNRVSRDQVFYG